MNILPISYQQNSIYNTKNKKNTCQDKHINFYSFPRFFTFYKNKASLGKPINRTIRFQEVFRELEYKICNEKLLKKSLGRDIVVDTIRKCFPDYQDNEDLKKAYDNLESQLWTSFSDKNTTFVLCSIQRILTDPRNEGKSTFDFFKEIENQMIKMQAKTESNIPKVNTKGWTKEQFFAHILDVVCKKDFCTSMLKPPEIRNLARLFKITPEQVINLDKETYRKLVLDYHPDLHEGNSDYIVILNALFSGKSKV